MSVAHLVSSLQERVRFRCALPAFTADTNVTTADILLLVQESVRELCGLMAEFNPDAYFATTSDLATTANVASVALPTSFTKLLQIHWKKSASETIPLRLANLEDVGLLTPTLDWVNKWPAYRLEANTLEFFPTPKAVYTVAVRYSTGLFPTAAGDTLQLELGWDEWVVLDCCCKVRQRQEKAYSEFAGERTDKEMKIKDRARRDRVGYAQTRDVSREAEWKDPAGDWWRL